MAFPTTSVLDDFNRVDSASLGANWAGHPLTAGDANLRIVSNTCQPQAGPVAGDNTWTVSTYGPDCEAYVTMPTAPAGKGGHIFLRWTLATAGVGYSVSPLQGTGIRIYRWDAGPTATQLGSTIAQAISAGDSFGVQMIGSTLEVWYKVGAGAWTSLGTRTDATYGSAGYLGLHTDGLTYDDFGGGTYVPAASGTAMSGGLLLRGVG